MKPMPDMRPSPIAGLWYSDDPQLLSSQIDGFIQAAQLPKLDGEILAVIAPHAGLRYSGPVAGYAFRALLGMQVDLAAVISPMHQPYPQPLLSSAHAGYQTPLGSIDIDQEALSQLERLVKVSTGLNLSRISRDSEHSLEIELPFLQRALHGDFRLLPVMLREQDPDFVRAFAIALARTLRGKRAIMVASTDLSHFYSQSVAKSYDAAALHEIGSFSPDGLYKLAMAGEAFACGVNAVAAVLWAAQELGADHVQVLHHATSGDVTGDFQSVVGYGAAVVLKRN